MKILITGGVKAGKSSRALSLAHSWRQTVCFIATASACDDEMRERIEKHKAERAALGWKTIEEQLDLGAALSLADDYIIIDCLPMWLNNIFYYKREADFDVMLDDFLHAFSAKKNCIVVSNETGLGNIPFDALTRRYNLMLAKANRETARIADKVELLVCGLALNVK